MIEKNDLPGQTELAFDFIQKLYLEISYMIKEVEGLLYEQEEKFVIGRPSGYGISTKSSTGLESTNVNFWLLRRFAVSFIPEEMTKLERGQTITNISDRLLILHFRFVLNDKEDNPPAVYSGIFHGIKAKAKWITKFEKAMTHLAYNDEKIFKNFKQVEYEDAHIKVKGEFLKNNLYDINDSEAIQNRIIEPSLRLYRKYSNLKS
jgi:hypothetical protein